MLLFRRLVSLNYRVVYIYISPVFEVDRISRGIKFITRCIQVSFPANFIARVHTA